MRKVEYPIDPNFKKKYKAIFGTSFNTMQTDWDNLRRIYPNELGGLPSNLEDILTADYGDMVVWYNNFMRVNKATRNTINDDLLKVFDYEKWSEEIAKFFINPTNKFNLSSCHYCDMSYINAYEVNPIAEALFFLNSASDSELDKITSSNSRKQVLKQHRPFIDKAQFELLGARFNWKNNKWDRTFHTNNQHKYHFDLDHVLPKSNFQLTALSLYNFVPSCQVCNQRLKRTRVLGLYGVPNVDLSPTSRSYNFDENTMFSIIPLQGVMAGSLCPTLHPDNYTLQLNTLSNDYKYFISLFRLKERYQQHKKVALHWVEMKSKYTDARIQMMANALSHPSFSFDRIKSDIFQSGLYESGNLSFMKLRKDMLK